MPQNKYSSLLNYGKKRLVPAIRKSRLSPTSELWEFQPALMLRCQVYSNGISVDRRRNGPQTLGSQLKWCVVSVKRRIFVDEWQWQVTVDVFPLTRTREKLRKILKLIFIYRIREGALSSSESTRLHLLFLWGVPCGGSLLVSIGKLPHRCTSLFEDVRALTRQPGHDTPGSLELLGRLCCEHPPGTAKSLIKLLG